MKNRLAKHIETLLTRELCVVVRGLGGFVVEAKSAYWDRESLLAFPPSLVLHFNERLDYQDGFLEERYAEVYGISLRRARIMIDEDVRALRSELIKHKTYSLEGLGVLSLSPSGVMSFEPQLSSAFHSVAYGLAPVAIPNVQQKTSAGLLESTEKSKSPYFTLRLSKRAVAWSSAAAILLLALFPWGNTKQGELPQTYQAGLAPNTTVVESLWHKDKAPSVEPQAEVESLRQQIEEQNEEKAVPEVIKVEDEVSLYLTPTKGRYYVIIASEYSEDLIKQHYSLAKDQGEKFPELGVIKVGRTYRLSGASFETATGAYTLVKKLEAEDCPAWVYKAK